MCTARVKYWKFLTMCTNPSVFHKLFFLTYNWNQDFSLNLTNHVMFHEPGFWCQSWSLLVCCPDTSLRLQSALLMFHPVKRGAGRKDILRVCQHLCPHTGIFTAVILWAKAETNQTDNEELASMNADSYVTLEHIVETAANGQPARSAPARQEVTLHTSRWQQSVFRTEETRAVVGMKQR